MEQQNNEQLQQQLTARLTTIMQAKNITPTMLASVLGLNPSNVTGFLQGKKNPTLLTMQRLALALDVPLWMLITTPDAITADLQQMGLMPEPATAPDAQPADDAAQSVPSDSVTRIDETTATTARKFDLCTIDPQTGETRLYRLVKP